MRNFIKGVLVTVALLAVVAIMAIWLGFGPMGADTIPSGFEKWAASEGLNAAVARQARGLRNPLSATEDNLLVRRDRLAV